MIISHSFFIFWLYFIVFTGFFTVSLILFSRLCYVFPLYPKRKKKPESFSDKPLNAIYACHSFSSQNHFLKMFKTYTDERQANFVINKKPELHYRNSDSKLSLEVISSPFAPLRYRKDAYKRALSRVKFQSDQIAKVKILFC